MANSAYPAYPVAEVERDHLLNLVRAELSGGRSQIEVVRQLTETGWPSFEAWQLVEGVAGDIRERSPRSPVPRPSVHRPSVQRAAAPVRHPLDREFDSRATTVSPAAPAREQLWSIAQPGNPVCSICGRQDESLRIVVYPWVASALLITFRRAFVGLWCPRHRAQRHALASLITLTVGWFGIPWGLFFTPLVLIQLAQGGEKPDTQNADMLRDLARIKLDHGDVEGAVRCLEHSLQFQDSSAVRARLRNLRARIVAEPEGLFASVLPIIDALVKAFAIGLLVGIASRLSDGFSIVLDISVGMLAAFLFSWVSKIAFLFIGGMFVAQVTEQSLATMRMRSAVPGALLGVILAIVALYGLLEGSAMIEYVAGLIIGGSFTSTFDALVMGLRYLFVGGFMWLRGPVSASPIYAGMIGLAAVYFFWLAVRAALRTVDWQKRLEDGTP